MLHVDMSFSGSFDANVNMTPISLVCLNFSNHPKTMHQQHSNSKYWTTISNSVSNSKR